MTTTTTTTWQLDIDEFRRPPLGRLGLIEFRKMANTRAGLWLLIITALIAVGSVVLQLTTADERQRTFADILSPTLMLVSVLLPVLGILSVTSEWSQRTAQTTFTIVPMRSRIVAAKLLAGGILAAVSVGACLAAAAAGNLLVGGLVDGNGAWSIELSAIGTAFLYQLISILVGMAFGMLVQNSALAIVLHFILLSAWAILGQFIEALETPQQWLSQEATLTPLIAGGMTGEDWAQLGTTVAVWAVLPLVVGIVRLFRRDIS